MNQTIEQFNRRAARNAARNNAIPRRVAQNIPYCSLNVGDAPVTTEWVQGLFDAVLNGIRFIIFFVHLNRIQKQNVRGGNIYIISRSTIERFPIGGHWGKSFMLKNGWQKYKSSDERFVKYLIHQGGLSLLWVRDIQAVRNAGLEEQLEDEQELMAAQAVGNAGLEEQPEDDQELMAAVGNAGLEEQPYDEQELMAAQAVGLEEQPEVEQELMAAFGNAGLEEQPEDEQDAFGNAGLEEHPEVEQELMAAFGNAGLAEQPDDVNGAIDEHELMAVMADLLPLPEGEWLGGRLLSDMLDVEPFLNSDPNAAHYGQGTVAPTTLASAPADTVAAYLDAYLQEGSPAGAYIMSRSPPQVNTRSPADEPEADAKMPFMA
ncbi:hypothetical protein CAOG_05578 [Capsaspora owczarzaki ATCC 30864]|uniref:Uncharacterized protein n=1 Tax=Capsaspora owczarzaki (strain ATCC 30864) TaxID=595528 RepID=A0A0D2UIZ2_CAPO3|nr:hypothetical protein CAOG_05578 [Capsaspora owczarzaki ATCC 30864]KJE95086.1 hypothetical protein CAOG_005578 [Capsaspora owczarzaki ATCC 30864]|eukprot:XP_004346251.1 hypothetical protein CAOG_05578 [Capsaspora owczarzaki ATCC 30864]